MRLARWLFVAAIALASTRAAAEEVVTDNPVRVRIAYGADAPIAWRGEIRATNGSVSGLSALPTSVEAVGAAWLDGARGRVFHRTPIGRGAMDLTIAGDEATLVIALADPETQRTLEAAFPVADIRSGRPIVAYGAAGGRVVVQRLAADRLRIDAAPERLIFAPGEQFDFRVVADPPGVEPGSFFEFTVDLLAAGDDEPIWTSGAERIAAPPRGLAAIPVRMPLPSREGAYRVALRVTRPPGFAQRFRVGGAPKTLCERSLEVVVFDPRATPTQLGEWTEAYAFDPASPRWRDRLPAWTGWRRLAWLDVGPFGSQTGRGAAPTRDGFVEIDAAPERGGAHWQAYPLAVGRPGEPCLVEVELPADADQQLGLGLFEENGAGALAPLGDAVVTAPPRWNRSSAPRVARVVFWPRTDGPLLALHNPDPQRVARFGRIRVLQADRTAAAAPPRPIGQVAIDFDDPNLARFVGVAEGAPGADLATAKRLADCVELAGATGAVVSVNRQGSAIYASSGVGDGAAYDRRRWFEGTNDLPRRPLLELLLREFDRRGLSLTTALDFDTPLPATTRELAANGAPAPPTGVLDPSTRRAMLAAIDALRAQGATHASFAGVALRIGPGSSLLLEGDAAGYDAATVDRFLAEHQRRWPPGAERSADAHAAAIGETLSAEWDAWRDAQLANFYTEAALRGSPRDRELGSPLLLGRDLHRAAELIQATTPRLASTLRADDAARRIGLGPFGSGQSALAAPWCVSLANPLSRHAATSAATDRLREALARADSPAMISADRWRTRLVDSAKWFGGAEDATLRCVAAPLGGDARALAETIVGRGDGLVVDGGPVAVGWQDARSIALRELIAALPGGAVATPSAAADAELAVRVIRRERDASLIVVNPTPWRREAAIEFEVDDRCLVTSAPVGDTPSVWREPGRHSLPVALAPGEAKAWRLLAPSVAVTDVTVSPSDAATEELAAALDTVRRRDRAARRPIDVIANPSFERLAEDGGIVGWARSPNGEARAEGNAYAGQTALLLASPDGDASVTSDPFPAPETGQLAVLLRADGRGMASAAELRLDLESTDGDYGVHTTVPAAQLAQETAGEATVWRELVFAVDDLPLGGEMRLRLRIALIGGGELRVDEVRTESLKLPIASYDEDHRPQNLALLRMLTSAESAIEQGRAEACREILDSYWPRFLTAYFPLEAPPPAVAESSPPDAETPAEGDETDAEEQTPSVAERLRGYWPSFLR